VPFAINASALRLRPTTQRLSEMLEHDVCHARFMTSLREYLDSIGAPLRKAPVLAGREIDLYQLYEAVKSMGGYHAVTQDKRWADVGQVLKVKEASHAAYALRQNYQKLLLQFELAQRAGADGTGGAASPIGSSVGGGPGGSLPLPEVAAVLATEAEAMGAATAADSAWSEDGGGGGPGNGGASSLGSAGCASGMMPASCGSLALRLQDIEERIPWGALRAAEGQWDWEVLRPAWLLLLTEGPPRVRTVAQALCTLEEVLGDKVLVEGWANRLRAAWHSRLMAAATPTHLGDCLLELERSIRWADFDDRYEELRGVEGVPSHSEARKPGRPAKRGRYSGGTGGKQAKRPRKGGGDDGDKEAEGAEEDEDEDEDEDDDLTAAECAAAAAVASKPKVGAASMGGREGKGHLTSKGGSSGGGGTGGEGKDSHLMSNGGGRGGGGTGGDAGGVNAGGAPVSEEEGGDPMVQDGEGEEEEAVAEAPPPPTEAEQKEAAEAEAAKEAAKEAKEAEEAEEAEKAEEAEEAEEAMAERAAARRTRGGALSHRPGGAVASGGGAEGGGGDEDEGEDEAGKREAGKRDGAEEAAKEEGAISSLCTLDGFRAAAVAYKATFFAGEKGATIGGKGGAAVTSRGAARPRAGAALHAAEITVAPSRVEAEFWSLVCRSDRGGGGAAAVTTERPERPERARDEGGHQRSSGAIEHSERARDHDTTHAAVAYLVEERSGAGAGVQRPAGMSAASGFVCASDPGAELEGAHASSPWNLRNLPGLPSCLTSHLLGKDAPPAKALAEPLLRFAMLFASDGWRTSRHFWAELTYLHQGAPISWLGVAAEDARALERLCAREVPGGELRLTETSAVLPALLPPSILLGAQLHVAHAVQQPGEFVLALPRAYHATIAHGFACYETVPFGSVDWLPYGAAAAALHAAARTAPLIGFETLVLRAVERDSSVSVAEALLPQVERLIARYAAKLAALRELGLADAADATDVADVAGVDAASPPAPAAGDEATSAAEVVAAGEAAVVRAAAMAAAVTSSALGEAPACCVCAQPCALALVTCPCRPSEARDTLAVVATVRCLEHALEPGAVSGALGDTGSSGARLHERHARARLVALRAVLHGRLARRTLWLREAAEALERPAGQPAAALPALEALLCGAEALQLDHPTARTLRSVVARGQEWEVSARLHVSSRATHTPDALLSLLERADTLPASLPTRPALEAVLDAARRWQVAADRLLEGARPPPERLWNPSAAAGEAAIQALLEQPEAGQLLLPQAAELERELRRRGWLSRCAGTLAPARHPDLEVVSSALTDAHELQLEHLAEASELRSRFNAAAKWAQRANLALRRRSTLVALEALRAEAAELSVGVEQLAEVDERIQRASAWAARAKAALSMGAAQLDEVRLSAIECD